MAGAGGHRSVRQPPVQSGSAAESVLQDSSRLPIAAERATRAEILVLTRTEHGRQAPRPTSSRFQIASARSASLQFHLMNNVWLRRCDSFAEEAKADRDFWAHFTADERVGIVEQIRREWMELNGRHDEGL